MKKKLWGCLGFLLFLSLGFGFFGFYLWHKTIPIPGFLAGRLKSIISSQFGMTLTFSSAEIVGKPGKVEMASFSLSLPGEKPFFSGKKALLNMGKTSSLWNAYKGQIPIELISGEELVFDLTAPLPKSSGENSGISIPGLKRMTNDLCTIKFWGGEVKFSNISFDVDHLKKTGSFHFKLQENPFGGKGVASGTINLASGPSQISMNWDDSDLEKIHLVFLRFMPAIHALSGKLNLSLSWEGNLADRIKDPLANLTNVVQKEVHGIIRFRDVETLFHDLPVKLEGYLQKSGEKGLDLQVNAKIASGTVHGSVSGNLEQGKWSGGSFAIEGTDIYPDEKVFSSLGIEKLPFSLDRINFSCGGIVRENYSETCSGTATIRDSRHQKFICPMIELSWENSRGQMLASLSTKLFAGRLHLVASTALPLSMEKKIEVRGNMFQIQGNALTALVQKPFEGLINGEFFLAFTAADYLRADYSGKFLIQNPGIFPYSAREFSGGIQGKGKDWRLEDAQVLFADGGFIKFKGILSLEENQGKFFIRNFSPQFFGLNPRMLHGKLSCDGSVSGKIPNLKLDGNAWSQSLVIGTQEFATMKAHVAIRKDTLTLTSLLGKIKEGGNVEGYGSINLFTQAVGNMKLNLSKVDLSLLRKFKEDLFITYPVSGEVNGSIEKKSTALPSRFDFNLSGNNIVIASETLKSFLLEGNTRGDRLEIRRMPLQVFGGNVNLSWDYDPHSGFIGKFEVNDSDLAKIQNVKKVLGRISGSLSLNGNVEWTKEKKEGAIFIQGKKWVMNGVDVGNFVGNAGMTPDGIRLTQADFQDFKVTATGTVGFQGQKPYEAAIHFDRADLAFIPGFDSATGFFQKGELMVEGSVQMRGRSIYKLPDEAFCSLEKMEIRHNNGAVFAKNPIQIQYQKETFSIKSFSLAMDKGILELVGSCKLAGPCDFTFSGTKIPLSFVGNVFRKSNLGIDGMLSAKGGMAGTYPDLSLNGAIKVENLSYGGKVIPEISAKVKLNKAGGKVEPFVISLPGSKIILNGFFPFPKGENPGVLDITVNVASGPLDDLLYYFPQYFNKAIGSVHASIRFFGNPLAPVISGEAKLEAAVLGSPDMKQPLRNVELGLTTKGGVVLLSPVKAMFGKGLLHGDGAINFCDGIGSLTARIFGENLDFNMSGLELKKAKASFSASGTLYNPIIRGNIYLPQGKFQISDNLFKTNNATFSLPLKSLDYAFEIEIPRNFWLRNSFVNAEMKGKMTLAGNLKTFHLSGGCQTLRGWIYFQRRKFTIDNGEIKFREHNGKFDPYLFFKSATTIQNIKVFLTLQGNLSSFTPKLYSSPPMSEGDIIALLTFGMNKQDALRADPKALFEKEIVDGLKNTYLSGLLSSSLSNVLSLDELYVGSLFDRTKGVSRSFVHIGKYVGNNIFLAYEGTLAQDDSPKTFFIEYKLPKGLTVDLEMKKPGNEIRLGLKYEWSF
ncbi:MAG: translocation/assembly module TamB domain-containing protein [Candidatus Riflebacteria bacterium]|nr:translocation/assembly module TamB domain-containing protein [Candidatus Riflebacteria bacterium]